MAIKSSRLYDGVEVVNIGDGDAGIEGYGSDGVGAANVTLYVDKEDIPRLLQDLEFFYRSSEGVPK